MRRGASVSSASDRIADGDLGANSLGVRRAERLRASVAELCLVGGKRLGTSGAIRRTAAHFVDARSLIARALRLRACASRTVRDDLARNSSAPAQPRIERVSATMPGQRSTSPICIGVASGKARRASAARRCRFSNAAASSDAALAGAACAPNATLQSIFPRATRDAISSRSAGSAARSSSAILHWTSR